MDNLNQKIENLSLKGVTSDSRKVQKDFAFVAIKGEKQDGTLFIPQAINSGAKLIVTDKSYIIPSDAAVKFIQVDNPRLALSRIAAYIYKKQPENIVAVTGTNGKTSVTYFYRGIWGLLGQKSASIGTIGVIDEQNNKVLESSLTTGDPVFLHQTLENLAGKNIEFVSIEASSHGLDQHRLDSINIKAAAFTNFTRDHLDYHQTMESYLDAKLRLFDSVMKQGGVAVLNSDIPEYELIKEKCHAYHHQIIDYGKNAKSIKLISITPIDGVQQVSFAIGETNYNVHLNLIGEFQVYNVLCALGLAIATGADKNEVVKVLPRLENVPGRMERVKTNLNDKYIFVDYAHTADALEKALKVLRDYTNARIIVVLGAGGERDKARRFEMGKVADKYADLAIITDDNPRGEDPAVIRKEIISTCKKGIEVAGRAEAIEYAIRQMQEKDILLIAGKGHEKYQIIGSQIFEFDDVNIAAKTANSL
jgi:UDP-N-acetylmuramoyl-L-alanyl-D-glutamate--2,6-diaminopimelate ligase